MSLSVLTLGDRLRQVDVKAEHFERQISRVEQERDGWEKKYEVRPTLAIPSSPSLSARLLEAGEPAASSPSHHADLALPSISIISRQQEAMEKYAVSKRELDEVVSQMEVSLGRSLTLSVSSRLNPALIFLFLLAPQSL